MLCILWADVLHYLLYFMCVVVDSIFLYHYAQQHLMDIYVESVVHKLHEPISIDIFHIIEVSFNHYTENEQIIIVVDADG